MSCDDNFFLWLVQLVKIFICAQLYGNSYLTDEHNHWIIVWLTDEHSHWIIVWDTSLNFCSVFLYLLNYWIETRVSVGIKPGLSWRDDSPWLHKPRPFGSSSVSDWNVAHSDEGVCMVHGWFWWGSKARTSKISSRIPRPRGYYAKEPECCIGRWALWFVCVDASYPKDILDVDRCRQLRERCQTCWDKEGKEDTLTWTVWNVHRRNSRTTRRRSRCSSRSIFTPTKRFVSWWVEVDTLMFETQKITGSGSKLRKVTWLSFLLASITDSLLILM